MTKSEVKAVIYKYLWLILLVIGVAGFIHIYFFTPRTYVIESIWEYFVEVFVFMILSSSIAFFPNKSKKGFLLLVAAIVFYAGFIGSKLDYVGYRQLMTGSQKAADEYYVVLYFLLYPFVVTCLSFGYRIGGGTSGNCIKISFVGVLILFSSFLNIMFEIVYASIPTEPIEYVYFFKVIVGHFPTFTEEVIFCLCHVPLVVGCLATLCK